MIFTYSSLFVEEFEVRYFFVNCTFVCIKRMIAVHLNFHRRALSLAGSKVV